jgi:HD-GYP domain-containing protein (c-di-GMP phosphodiesterase class II)
MDAVVDPSHPKKKGQKTCDVHEIRSILKNGSGNQFDPAVAEAFCELLGDESIIKKLSAANGNKGPPPTQ